MNWNYDNKYNFYLYVTIEESNKGIEFLKREFNVVNKDFKLRYPCSGWLFIDGDNFLQMGFEDLVLKEDCDNFITCEIMKNALNPIYHIFNLQTFDKKLDYKLKENFTKDFKNFYIEKNSKLFGNMKKF